MACGHDFTLPSRSRLKDPALVATLSFDFFFTRPYGSSAMTSREDTQTAIALLLVGGVAGLLAARAQRATADARSGNSSVRRIHRVKQMIAQGDDATMVNDAVRREIAVVSGGVAFGRLVVESDPTIAVSLDERIAAVILANALGHALEMDPIHSNS